jgi:transcriptional regulator with XRE-family HTH domain
MTNFPRVLKELRKQRGLTQKALADRIGKSPPYIAALEMEEGGRGPSVAMLRNLATALASDEGRQGLDCRAVASLLFAALDLECVFPPENQDAEALSKAMDAATEVWIISELLTEATTAKATARNITSPDKRFVFLVPFLLPKRVLDVALENLRQMGLTEEQLRARISIFQVSACALPARIWITDPLSGRPQGFYSIGSFENPDQEIRRMPASSLTYMINTYSNLCSMFHADRRTWTDGDVEPTGCPEFGYIQLHFPPQDSRDPTSNVGRGLGHHSPFATV